MINNPNTAESNEYLDQPGGGQAIPIEHQLDKKQYRELSAKVANGNANPEEIQRIENHLDADSDPENAYQHPLSPEHMEGLERDKAGERVETLAADNHPFMATVMETEQTVSETNQIIDEILDEIKAAKKKAGTGKAAKWVDGLGIFAPVVNLPFSLFGLISSRGLKKKLDKIEVLNRKLNDPRIHLDSSLKSENVNSGAGHGAMLGATTLGAGAAATAGSGVYLTAWHSIAVPAAVTGGLAAPVTLGIGSLALGIAAIVKMFKGHKANQIAIEDLNKLEGQLMQVRGNSGDVTTSIDDAKDGFREEALQRAERKAYPSETMQNAA